jgi:hypothetical protein
MSSTTTNDSKRQFGVQDRKTLLMLSGSRQEEEATKLHEYRWDHFITLTYRFGRPAGVDKFADLHGAVSKDVTAFRREIMRRQRSKFFCYWVVEDDHTSHPHVHLLTANLKISQRDLQKCWEHGQIHCKKIDPSDESRKRLIGYVVKQVPYSLHPESDKYTKGLHLLLVN